MVSVTSGEYDIQRGATAFDQADRGDILQSSLPRRSGFYDSNDLNASTAQRP